MEIEILIDGLAKKLAINCAESANTGDVLFLSEPQHIDYYTSIKFNCRNPCHQRYLKRGLLFKAKSDALLFSRSFIAGRNFA